MNKIAFFLILLSFLPITASSGQKSNKKIVVSGLVTDSLKNPVTGALIFVDKQNTNIVTDNSGYYKVRVRPGAETITIITLNNYTSVTAIDGRTSINFTIASSGSSLQNNQEKSTNNEGVNIGYGKVDQKNLTTSVNKRDGQSGKYATYMSIYEILKSIPGVRVSGHSIRIQGQSSVNLGSDPLLVVDGMVVSSIDNISPTMVENVSVLKGASASIYGSRGANGVILITLIKHL